MASRSSKRLPNDGVLPDTKKKKTNSNEKCNLDKVDVMKEKAATVWDGHSRQKKAFFAYFGKTLDEGKKGSANSNKNNACKAELMNENSTTIINYGKLHLPIDKNIKNVHEKKSNNFNSHNNCFMKENTNLPYFSSFIEELGYFPKIAHTGVNWLTPSKKSDLILNLNEEILNIDEIKHSIILFQSSSSKPRRLVLEPHSMEINLPYMIASLKKSTPYFPVSRFHKYMKKMCLLVNKSTTNIEPMWIDKYKPMLEEEVLGNSELVKRLKQWLKPIKKKTNKCKTYDSDDDYIFESDSDSSNKVQVQHNLAILLGPSGCGKTSAVYAVANELNANVIELNASCNRNGKRIITDLMEATQSHAVEKNGLFNLIKGKSKKTKNLKEKKIINEKMTIILIEDADILFENYDDGYLSAISTLVTDSKRPLILTANDPLSDNLLKFFVSSKMILNFVHPPKQDLNCFLQLMALSEGAIMSENEIKTFINPLKPDIRQSILQLQYILSTGEIDNKTLNCTNMKCINSIWWNWSYALGCDSINIDTDKKAKSNINIADISYNLDVLSRLNLINAKTQSCNFLDPQPFWHYIAIRDSSSLIETSHWSDNSVRLSTDIFHWMHNHINTRDHNCEKLYPTPEDLNRRQRMWNTSKDILDQIGLDFCNRKNSTCFDYMATIRSLSRNQQVNQPFANLRQSKMFSYLRRINIEVDSSDLKHFCESFQFDSNCQLVNQSDQL